MPCRVANQFLHCGAVVWLMLVVYDAIQLAHMLNKSELCMKIVIQRVRSMIYCQDIYAILCS